eukprot:TRINITY_DN7596_c0_g1_i1.p1 TRINITY_DN7596_c0_g1~~TRINITY_DN7596_c0_g1_i1.p1  ORF type:complete len:468 (-),score=97.45 TRINITY_DN7596_c0_g1_i1:13-1416(-)
MAKSKPTVRIDLQSGRLDLIFPTSDDRDNFMDVFQDLIGLYDAQLGSGDYDAYHLTGPDTELGHTDLIPDHTKNDEEFKEYYCNFCEEWLYFKAVIQFENHITKCKEKYRPNLLTLDDEFVYIEPVHDIPIRPKIIDESPFVVTVTHPKTVKKGGEVYVVFKVSTQTTQERYRESTDGDYPFKYIVYRRFSDFSNLRRSLVNYNPLASVPPLPSKSMMNRFNRNFLATRGSKLDQFLNVIVKNPLLNESDELFKFLTMKLHNGAREVEPTDSKGYISILTDNSLAIAIENKLSSALNSNGYGEHHTIAEQEYSTLLQSMEKWKITPKKIPYKKYITLVTGGSDSGKTSFANNFFGLSIKAIKFGPNSTENNFTIMESVPEKEFRKYKSEAHGDFPSFKDDELLDIVEDINSDPRYGFVFVYLDTQNSLTRYSGILSAIETQLRRYNRVQTILINENYLKEDDRYNTM